MYLFRIPELIKIIYKKAIWNGPRDEKIIYLTFDDGPVPGSTDRILDVLRQFRIKASFFCVGENIRKYPDLFKRIIQEGHCVGNHTMHHINGWTAKSDDYLWDIHLCEEEMAKHRGATDKLLFRPPYGKIKTKVLSVLSRKYHVIMWDVLSYDFDLSLDKNKCLINSIKYTNPGTIIIFHDSEKTRNRTDFIIYQYIVHFINENFNFSTLDELILKDC